MSFLALLISIIALIFAYKAYQMSGGTAEELKSKIDDLGISTDNLRQKTADAVNRFEKFVRGEKKESETVETETGEKEADTEPKDPDRIS